MRGFCFVFDVHISLQKKLYIEKSFPHKNNLHAFTATALLLADNGAAAGGRDAERTAALRYFAGWGNARNPTYSFYGDGVMGFVDQFQADIETLSGS